MSQFTFFERRSNAVRSSRRSRRASIRCLRAALCCAALVLGPARALAHQVWLETHSSGVKLCFGEFADNQREASPGYLDKLAQPRAHRIGADGAQAELLGAKSADGIVFRGLPEPGQSVIAVDLAYPLIEGKDGDKPRRTAWTPAARYVTKLRAEPAKLTLDVLPTGKAGEFQVLYRGAPLANAELTLVASSGWSRPGRTDAGGKVTFALPWKGAYALLVRHKDATPGQRKSASGADEKYDVASYATTLTFATSSGLPSPPPPPAAPPNVMR